MAQSYSVSLRTVAEEQGFLLLHTSSDYEEAQIYTADVNRPGLQLAGYYDYFDPRGNHLHGAVFLGGSPRPV